MERSNHNPCDAMNPTGAIQIISFNEERKLELNNKAALENILTKGSIRGLPIAVLSVVGAFRTGKSFLSLLQI